MKHYAIILLVLLFVVNSYGQSPTYSYNRINVEIIKEKKPKRVFARAELSSQSSCVDSTLTSSLENKLLQLVRNNKRIKAGQYIVSVQFIVATDCTISDVKPLTMIGYGMEAEVVRAIKKKTSWTPSSQGIPIRPYRTSSSTSLR